VSICEGRGCRVLQIAPRKELRAESVRAGGTLEEQLRSLGAQ
jgi:hypothetical protein